MDAFDEFLKSNLPEVQAVCQKLRGLVKSARPEALELICISQNHIAFSLEGSAKDHLVYLVLMSNYVRLVFIGVATCPIQIAY